MPLDAEARRTYQRNYMRTYGRRQRIAQGSLLLMDEQGRLSLMRVQDLFDVLHHWSPRERSATLPRTTAGRAQVAAIALTLKRLAVALPRGRP